MILTYDPERYLRGLAGMSAVMNEEMQSKGQVLTQDEPNSTDISSLERSAPALYNGSIRGYRLRLIPTGPGRSEII